MARWTASAKWAAGPALDGQCAMPLALRLSEGLGVTGVRQRLEHIDVRWLVAELDIQGVRGLVVAEYVQRKTLETKPCSLDLYCPHGRSGVALAAVLWPNDKVIDVADCSGSAFGSRDPDDANRCFGLSFNGKEDMAR